MTLVSFLTKNILIEHEAAILRYSKLSKKKETDPARQEANEDVFVFRKRFHQVSILIRK